MKLKVFAVYDSKAVAYMQPFFTTTIGQAVRMFQDAVMAEDSNFAKHAEDYTLFHIGEYDEESGILSALSSHVSLGCAIEYVARLKEIKT